MTLSTFFKKRWQVVLWRGNGILLISASFAGNKSLYSELLENIYQSYEKIVLSQFIDENQCHINNRANFITELQSQYSTSIATTTDFAKNVYPEEYQDIYVLHSIAEPTYEFLNRFLYYGMNSVPNIIYPYTGNTLDWLSNLIEWNRRFLEWYNLEKSDDVLSSLADQADMISWTSDYQLYFCVTNVEQVSRILAGFDEIGNRRNLLLHLETRTLNKHER